MSELMELFAHVVEQASLNKVAQLLNLSQPSLSRKLIRLEEELGVQLFYRRGKRLEITRAGQICYDFAVEQREQRRKLELALEPFKSRTKPANITIGASLTTLQSTLPELITLFTTEYPSLDIKAITGKSHEIVPLVKERKVDIGLVASAIDHAELHCTPLFEDHLCLVLPQGHPLVEPNELQMNDLAGLPMILFSQGTWYRVLMDDLFQRHQLYPDVRMEIDSFEAIIRLVATCRTASLLPKSYLRRHLLGQNELVIRHIPELRQTKRATCLLFTEDWLQLSAGTHVVERAVAYFSTHSATE